MTYILYRYILISEVEGSTKTQEENKMTKAERKAIESRTQDLVKQGVDKELAKVMAKAELETGLIRPVVNGNY